ncbi:MAG: heme lyase CcmF/NrfE family subunit [Polyangiaceae bacterium]
MWQSLPDFGTGVLYAVLVAAAYTFAVAVAAGRGKPRLLQSARMGAYATSALAALGVVLLAYAFVTHDFRIRYVARYSDRSMTTDYLLTALWGGQDGSLLWWAFLLAGYTTACVWWLKGRYRQLQPYVIATLMVIMGFFAVLMLFAANPFATSVGGAKLEGDGLNPLLQNYWMIIHPPALYMGFVGCAIPFAFSIAALITGRLDNEWIVAVRKWMLFAWVFLSLGNALGMIWAYEELGWGGYWAWDPVENAACLPWFTASAYVHSTMIQERRNMMKVWNVVLIAITFILTIFGTFLTRSGLIASVHSFAQSNIGIFFVWFMALSAAACIGLLVWRYPQLKSPHQIEAMASREAMFVVNNWALLGAMTFILVATMFPKISEWWWKETVTVGPPFFNRWMAPMGLLIFALMGLAPLFGWRKTSGESLKKAFRAPLIVTAVAAAAHLALGSRLGFPALVPTDQFYSGAIGVVLQKLGGAAPLITVSLSAFNMAVIVQEFQRGVAARRRSSDKAGEKEGVLLALMRLVDKSRRRYGGYIVHAGIVLMFLGFTGRAWSLDHETSMSPGESHQIGDYELTYVGPRMEVDPNKRMAFADIDVTRGGKAVGRVSPAKFIYSRSPDGPTTEVAMLRSVRDDLYVVVGSINSTTKRSTFQFHVNPLVSWIWAGVVVLLFGSTLSLWPELSERRLGAWSYVRTATAGASGIMLSIWIAMGPSTAHAASLRPKPPVASEAPTLAAPELSSLTPWLAPGLVALAFGAGAGAWRGRRRRP